MRAQQTSTHTYKTHLNSICSADLLPLPTTSMRYAVGLNATCHTAAHCFVLRTTGGCVVVVVVRSSVTVEFWVLFKYKLVHYTLGAVFNGVRCTQHGIKYGKHYEVQLKYSITLLHISSPPCVIPACCFQQQPPATTNPAWSLSLCGSMLHIL